MADNYLERKAEELKQPKVVVKRVNSSLDTLLKRNRSYRGYDNSRTITIDELKDIASVSCLCPSGMNRQTLRFRLVTKEDAGKVLPYITLGAALPDEHLPKPGMEPQAFIVICSALPEDRVIDMDLGIAAQSMLLRAAERGLNGIFILNFRAQQVQKALGLELKPLAVLAIGKGAENIFIVPAKPGESLSYYRKNGVHFVPKLGVEDLLV